MPTFSGLQIPPPVNWQDFETLSCDLWREAWKDPNTKKNGRQGQNQHGVDVCGRPNEKDLWAGVQCKGKDNYSNKSLTEKEVKDEVEKAKSFTPKLSQFIIATTGPKDANIEELGRTITEEHLRKGLFPVHIWGWEDIVNRLAGFPDVIAKHYPGFSVNTKALEKGIDEIKRTTQTILENQAAVKSPASSLPEKINTTSIANSPDISMEILTPEHQAELDHSKDLLKRYKPKEALDFLEKLKTRIYSSSHPVVKYRLLTNIGSAKLSLNKEQEAAKLFIEALQYNSDDDKALCNAALGYLLLGQLEEAKDLANKVITKNPTSSRAYSIIIQTSSVDEKLENILSKIPEPYRNESEVAYAIGHLARKRDDLIESKKWLQIAVDNDKENSPDFKGSLGQILLDLISKDQILIYSHALNTVQEESIRKSIELLTSAWNCIANADIDFRKLRLTWIVNRGFANNSLGNIEDAIKDIEIALEIEPDNPVYIKNRAALALETGDNEKAISLLKGIQSAKETPEASLLLAEVLRKKNEFKESISVISTFIKSNPPEHLEEEARRILILIYIDIKDFKNAKEVSDSMRSSAPTNIFYLIDAAQILRFSGRSNDALSLLNNAKEYITDSSSSRELLELADEFHASGQYEDAASIYGKIVVKPSNTPLTRKLLNCYYRAGKVDKALDICKSLHKKYGPLDYISEIESAIYEEIGDLPAAKRCCQEYLTSFPNDFGMKLRLAVTNFRSKDFKELDKFLNSSIEVDTLSLEFGVLLTHLYSARNLFKKSLDTMYEMRRKYFNKADAHLKYIGLILDREKDFDKYLSPAKVQIDTAVRIEDESSQKEWYLIENRKNADMMRREINTEHLLAKNLLGKSVGDEIVIKKGPLSNEIGRIIEIKSKYVYVLHESMSSFGKLFPDNRGFYLLNIGPEKEGSLPKGLQPILDDISKQQTGHQKVEQFYKEGRLTIGAFASLSRQNVLDVWSYMITKPDLGIKCCIGNAKERNHATSLLDNKPKLIVDMISLMTLHGIEAGDIIVSAFGKLGIAQSTLDFFQATLNERKGFQSRGFMVIGKEDDKFVRQEISSDAVERGANYIQGVMKWIEKNCEIIPCTAALKISRNRKQQIEECIGIQFSDTILISSEPGNLLYSDDKQLRSLAKEEHNVDGIWTQSILMHCIGTGILEETKYNEMVVKLACSHYYHTSINGDVLIEAARQSGWTPSSPYTTALQILSGNVSDEISALNVSSTFLYELWKQPILPEQRIHLILSLLGVITTGRKRHAILNKLKLYVKKRFYLLPLAEREITSLIDIWKQIHLI